MPKQTLTPNSYVSGWGSPGVAVTGTGSAVTALSDDSDSTYVRKSVNMGDGINLLVAFDSFTLPAANDVLFVAETIRAKSSPATGLWGSSDVALQKPGGLSERARTSWPNTNGAWVNDVHAPDPSRPGGGLWTQADLDGILVAFRCTRANTDSARAYISKMSVDVLYAARPTIAVTVVGGSPITDTSRPLFDVTLSAVNDGLLPSDYGLYELKVFSAAQYSAEGFDPSVTEPVWETTRSKGNAWLDQFPYTDGTSTTTITDENLATGIALDPTGDFRAYARGKRDQVNAQWGEWSYVAFTMDLDPVDAPTVEVTVDTEFQVVQVEVTTATKTGHTDPTVEVQRSDDAGATWVPVVGATDVPVTFGTTPSFIDYTAKRAVTISYRARATSSYGGTRLASDWTTVTPEEVIPLIGWNLKVPAKPTLNMLGALVDKDPDFVQTEDQGVFRTLGSRYPKVVHGAIGGVDGSLSIIALTDAEWTALEHLREYQGPIYVESPFGWGRWISVSARSWQELGAAQAARRPLKLDYLEVAGP